jgi:hypothetical protein
VSIDPRTAALPAGIQDPLQSQLAALSGRIDSLQRQINDQRSAPTVQIGAGTPAGFSSRDGTPYGQTNATFWVKFPTGWRGVSLPLT